MPYYLCSMTVCYLVRHFIQFALQPVALQFCRVLLLLCTLLPYLCFTHIRWLPASPCALYSYIYCARFTTHTHCLPLLLPRWFCALPFTCWTVRTCHLGSFAVHYDFYRFTPLPLTLFFVCSEHFFCLFFFFFLFFCIFFLSHAPLTVKRHRLPGLTACLYVHSPAVKPFCACAYLNPAAIRRWRSCALFSKHMPYGCLLLPTLPSPFGLVPAFCVVQLHAVLCGFL